MVRPNVPFVFEVVTSIAPPPVLNLAGLTLPTALMGQPYSQSIVQQVSGGTAPVTATQLSDVGAGVFATSSGFLITGTPTPQAAQVTDTFAYIVDEHGNVMVT
jgi:hypothetical protein